MELLRVEAWLGSYKDNQNMKKSRIALLLFILLFIYVYLYILCNTYFKLIILIIEMAE